MTPASGNSPTARPTTSTSYATTPHRDDRDELHSLGLSELERITPKCAWSLTSSATLAMTACRRSMAAWHKRVALLAPDEVRTSSEALVQSAEAKTRPVFDLYPKAVCRRRGTGSTGNYYIQPLHGSRPGLFYAGLWPQPKASLATTVYHGPSPANHLQMALAKS